MFNKVNIRRNRIKILIFLLGIGVSFLSLAEESEGEKILDGFSKAKLCLEAPQIILEIKKELKEESDKESLLDMIGMLASSCELWDEAIEAYEEMLKSGYKDSAVYNNLGRAYMNKGEFKKAEENLKESLKIEPENFFAFCNLGILYRLKGDYNNALYYFNKALEFSQWPSIYAELALTYILLKDYDKAIDSYKKAEELDRDNLYILKNLGMAHLCKGNKKEALNYFRKALKISPQTKELKELIQATQEALKNGKDLCPFEQLRNNF